ncbi:DUF2804 domain-containing protein [Olsenella sp. Marseille-P4559]|uniref:DUF2804 domain-containing protein n=1 Tax=Olsenella sp. Marseille-P4559 TaxID=2364795 RepID=UPI0010325700|nr:DUF2804 domain-containing protein [Olsenella sp. Marseille-P4559]
MPEHHITGTGRLLDEEGCLREPGWTTRPPFTYDHADIQAPPWRIKDWDYYLINDKHYAVALTFSDLGYLGLVSASVMDFAEKAFKTTSELVPLPMGSMGLPASSDKGDISWENPLCRVDWRHVGNMRRLSFSMRDFDEDAGEDLEVEVLLDRQPRDSMVICTPWDEDPHAFYYNRKIIGMRAWGGFRRGGLFHEFPRDDSFGLLDWGRGVWTNENTWYWAAAQGRQAGHVVGLNLGYGFGNTQAASENMAFVDGIAHKLGRIDFGIPVGENGYEYLSPWHMTDDEGRLDLVFSPEIDRTDNTNLIGLIVSRQHQVFGTFSGTVVLDDGRPLCVTGLRGSAEHIYNKY